MAAAHWILSVATLFLLTAPAVAQHFPRGVPLPVDVQLNTPAETLPPEVRSFSGRWAGSWGGILDHVLIVEDVSVAGRVTVVYAWGTAPQWNINKPGFSRMRGQIESGRLELRLRNGAAVTYVQRSADELQGEYELSGQVIRGIFKRVRE